MFRKALCWRTMAERLQRHKQTQTDWPSVVERKQAVAEGMNDGGRKLSGLDERKMVIHGLDVN